MQLYLISLAALISVINPLGTVPVFVGLTKDNLSAENNRIAKWTAINTLVILLVSFSTGNYLLQFFGISLNSLKIGGGLIIVSSGFALLTGTFNEHKGMKKRVREDANKRTDIALTPLAIPMLAGPGSISLLITFKQQYPEFLDRIILVGVLFSVCLLLFLTLRSAHLIVKSLGASGINALSRIVGFIVIAIGVEYIISALSAVLKSLQ